MEIVTENSIITAPIPKITLVEIFPEGKPVTIEEIVDEKLVLFEIIKKEIIATTPIQAQQIIKHISQITPYDRYSIGNTLRTFWKAGLVRMFLDPGPNRRRIRLEKEVAYYLIHNLKNYKVEYEKGATRAKPVSQKDAEWVRENKSKLSIIEMARRLKTSEWYIKKVLNGK